jgi:putative flippase GtrA
MIRFSNKILLFLLIGFLGVLINWLSFIILKLYTNMNLIFILIIVHFIVFIITYFLQKLYTFENRSPQSYSIYKFLINGLFYFIFDYILTYFFVNYLLIHPSIGKLLPFIFLTPFSYYVQKNWVFKL